MRVVDHLALDERGNHTDRHRRLIWDWANKGKQIVSVGQKQFRERLFKVGNPHVSAKNWV